jgi:phage-related protein
MNMKTQKPKNLEWIGSSKKDVRSFPEDVKDLVGFALRQAQNGGRHEAVKTLKGFEGAGVLEIIEDDVSGTYRAVYTVKFAEVVYVLHCFQKKSKRGIATPKGDIDLIKTRLKGAEEHYKENYKKQDGKDEKPKKKNI